MPQVGDPGAEEHFEGVALTRCKDAVTEDDEATAEHLVDELKKLANKMGRLLRVCTFCKLQTLLQVVVLGLRLTKTQICHYSATPTKLKLSQS
eukprot:COSAG05_NODE_4874_length_1340_cov_253.951652_1_plen_93_part_00